MDFAVDSNTLLRATLIFKWILFQLGHARCSRHVHKRVAGHLSSGSDAPNSFEQRHVIWLQVGEWRNRWMLLKQDLGFQNETSFSVWSSIKIEIKLYFSVWPGTKWPPDPEQVRGPMVGDHCHRGHCCSDPVNVSWTKRTCDGIT